MRYLIAKDKKKRELFCVNERKRLILKAIVMNEFLSKDIRNYSRVLLCTLPGYFVQIRNRCVLSGRARAVNKDLRVSRMHVKDLINNGFVEGMKKGSW